MTTVKPTTNDHEIKMIDFVDNHILILGSFPSIKSREAGFYYMHPQNRFWKMLSAVFDEEIPLSIEGKIEFLKNKGISLYDSLERCEIIGSSDLSIKNETPSDLSFFLNRKGKKKIIFNGKKSRILFPEIQRRRRFADFIWLPIDQPR